MVTGNLTRCFMVVYVNEVPRCHTGVHATQPRPSTPMAARVQEDEDFRPLAISLEGKLLEVASIDERVEEEEWLDEQPLTRMHYQVTLEDGRQVTIFRNMKTGGWYEIENPSPGTPR